MGTLTLTWLEVLLVVVAVVAIYVGELLLFLRVSRRSPPAAASSAGNAAAPPDGRGQLVALQADLSRLQAQIDALRRDVDTLRKIQQSSGQYREAVDMAQQGAAPEAIAEDCGISRAEAELIAALHRVR